MQPAFDFFFGRHCPHRNDLFINYQSWRTHDSVCAYFFYIGDVVYTGFEIHLGYQVHDQLSERVATVTSRSENFDLHTLRFCGTTW